MKKQTGNVVPKEISFFRRIGNSFKDKISFWWKFCVKSNFDELMNPDKATSGKSGSSFLLLDLRTQNEALFWVDEIR